MSWNWCMLKITWLRHENCFSISFPTPPEPYIYGEDEQITQWAEWQFQRLLHTGGKQWRPTGVEANVHATRFVEVDGEACSYSHQWVH